MSGLEPVILNIAQQTLDRVKELGLADAEPIEALLALLTKDGVTVEEIEVFTFTAAGQAAWTQITGLPTSVLDSVATMELLASSQIVMGMIVNNANLMQSIAASPAAMTAIAASATAMTAIAASPTAMATIIASPTAMAAIIASATAMTAIAASATAMAAIIASPTAMAAIIASATAMTAIAASPTAMAAIIASSTASVEVESLLQTTEMRTLLLLTLSDGSKFTKTTLSNVGATTQDITVGVGTNSIYLPVMGGSSSSRVQLYSVIRPNVLLRDDFPRIMAITKYTTLRGTRVTNDYGSVVPAMYLDFDVYTVI